MTYNYIQYTLVQLSNLQAGVQVIFTYLAVAAGVKIFQVVFLNTNWRTTLYLSCGAMQVMGIAWILVYHDVAGLLDPWFTIFITVNQVKKTKAAYEVIAKRRVKKLILNGSPRFLFSCIQSINQSINR